MQCWVLKIVSDTVYSTLNSFINLSYLFHAHELYQLL